MYAQSGHDSVKPGGTAGIYPVPALICWDRFFVVIRRI